jgi:hypothetical protein
MTDANRLQTSVWLGDLYDHFLKPLQLHVKWIPLNSEAWQ